MTKLSTKLMTVADGAQGRPSLRYLIVQLVGLAIALLLRPLLPELEDPERYIPCLIGGWLMVCALSYALCYPRGQVQAWWRRHWRSYLPELMTLLVLLGWAVRLGVLNVLVGCYLVLAIGYAVRREGRYRLGKLQLLYMAYALCVSLGFIWSENWSVSWRVYEKMLPLLLLPLTSIVMPIERRRVGWVTAWLCRLLVTVLTLQILVYLFLSFYYAPSLWACLGANKVYLAPLFADTVHNKMMIWASVIHPPIWLFYLVVPYMVQWDRRMSAYLDGARGDVPSDSLSVVELVCYGGLLVAFALINQPRYALWVVAVGGGWFPLRLLLRSVDRRVMATGLIGLSLTFALVVSSILSLFQDDERLEMLSRAKAYAWEHLPLGGGLGADAVLQLELYGHGHSHNSLLSMLVDMGLLGGVMVVGLWSLTIWLCVGRRGVGQNTPFLVMFALLFLLMLVDSALYIGLTLSLLSVYLCLLGGEVEARPSSRAKP